MIPVKAPHLLTIPLKEGFFAIVNSWFPDSLRIINKIQFDLLQHVDGKKNTQAIADELRIDKYQIEELLLIFQEDELVRFDSDFSIPIPANTPQSLNLWIHTTNRCNLSCEYCYIPTLNSPGTMTEDVRKQLLAQLLKTSINRGLKYIKLRLAGGEPLTQFNNWKVFFLQAKEALKKKGCLLELSFITNLTILNEEIIGFAKEHGISFGISLDGIGLFHNKTRKFHNGKGSFIGVDKNIDLLRRNNIRLSVSSVVTNDNMEGLPELTKYLVNKNIYFRYSIVKGEYINRPRLTTFLEDSFAIMENAIKDGWKFTEYFKLCDLKPGELGTQTCGAGFSTSAIYVDGGVYYCHVQFGNDTLANGSLFDENEDLISLIEKGKDYEGMKSSDCRDCNYKYVCTSGCPMYRVDDKDPNCNLYHKVIPILYRLQGMERLNNILKEYV